jgi:hypothetical protein
MSKGYDVFMGIEVQAPFDILSSKQQKSSKPALDH